MFDKSIYLRPIEHEKGIEKSELTAYLLDNHKIDDKHEIKGIAEEIGFNSNMICKVDYFVEEDIHVQLIELSDLQNSFRQFAAEISEPIAAINQDETIKDKWKREKIEAIKKKAWQSLRDEFLKKWSGSIAVIERLYRKTNQSAETDPQYSLLIVCLNETDVKMLDELNTEMNEQLGDLKERLDGACGMVKKVQVCNTSRLNKYLLS